MKKEAKSFTLLELMLTIIILAVLASISILSYRGIYERVQDNICKTHQDILNTAVELYAIDEDQLPLYLSQAWPRYKEKAVAMYLEEHKNDRGPYMLALNSVRGILENFSGHLAYAHTITAGMLPHKYFGDDHAVLDDPKDPTPASKGGVSYGILVKQLSPVPTPYTYMEYKNLPGGTVIIADSEDKMFEHSDDTPVIAADERHGVFQKYGNGRVKDGRRARKKHGRPRFVNEDDETEEFDPPSNPQ